MLLLHPLPTCADGGPDLCTVCPDLCTLCLWCYPLINQHKYSTCTLGGGHWLQLALVVFSFSHWHRHSLHRRWCYPLQLALVVFFLPPTGANTPLALKQLALCDGGLCWEKGATYSVSHCPELTFTLVASAVDPVTTL